MQAKALPPKVTGGWITARCDVPEHLLEQAKQSFSGFYGTFCAALESLPEVDAALREAAADLKLDIEHGPEEFYHTLRYDPIVDFERKRNWHTALINLLSLLELEQLESLGRVFDWEPSVRFKIRELHDRHAEYAAGLNISGDTVNVRTAARSWARVALTHIEGLTDPETGKDYELSFQKVTIDGKKVRVVTTACADRLPQLLLLEVMQACRDATGLSEEEVEDVVFPSGSASASSVPGSAQAKDKMSETVPTTASRDSSRSESDA